MALQFSYNWIFGSCSVFLLSKMCLFWTRIVSCQLVQIDKRTSHTIYARKIVSDSISKILYPGLRAEFILENIKLYLHFYISTLRWHSHFKSIVIEASDLFLQYSK